MYSFMLTALLKKTTAQDNYGYYWNQKSAQRLRR